MTVAGLSAGRFLRLHAAAMGIFVLVLLPGLLASAGRQRVTPVRLASVPERDGSVAERSAHGARTGRLVTAVSFDDGRSWSPPVGRAASRLETLPAGAPVSFRVRDAGGAETVVSGPVVLVSAGGSMAASLVLQSTLALVFALSGAAVAFAALDRRSLLAAAFLSGFGGLFAWVYRDANLAVIGSPALAQAFLVVFAAAPRYVGAAFVVRFFALFPADLSRTRAARAGGRITLATALAAQVLEVLRDAPASLPLSPRALASVARLAQDAQTAVYLLTAAASLVLIAAQVAAYRRGALEIRDRRRAEIVGAALLVGFGTTFAVTVTQSAWMLATGRFLFGTLAMSIAFLPLLVVPPALAHAVLAPRVEPIALLVRRAVLYAFAERTLRVAAVLPAVALAAFLYARRKDRLEELVSLQPVVLALLTAAGFLAVRYAPRARAALDRLFYRERQDTREVLRELAEKTRGASDSGELAELVAAEIDGALHLESVALFVRDAATGTFTVPESGPPDGGDPSMADTVNRPRVARDVPALDASSALCALVSGSHQPLDVDLTEETSPLTRLPAADRAWLEATSARLLVPLAAGDGSMLGLLVLGRKLSELPFDREDRLLLGVVAASGALALENRLLRSGSGHSGPPATGGEPLGARAEEELARLCPTCGLLQPPASERCPADGSRLRNGAVPALVAGRLRMEKLVGSGGMGVVYRARDLELGRPVAVKTLPRVTGPVSARLRREARLAATLLHPNIAAIFSSESWRGVPMLVFEYLDGGTLADRIAKGPVAIADLVRWGVLLARAIGAAHQAGILHRDLKPSNVGFTSGGVPKVLDFGLARMLHDSRAELGSGVADPAQDPRRLTITDRIVGTPPYLSPEAVRGDPPDESFDVWGLSVTLYEALTGDNPFVGLTLTETLDRVLTAGVPDPCLRRSDCSPRLADLLLDALSRDRRRRPASAEELAVELDEIAATLAP